MSMQMPAVQWDELWLPLRPYATNRLTEGIRRERRPVAMTRRYVEANPSALSNLLVVDVDHADAVLRAVSSVDSHPLPNAVVENPVNGHAHAVWALEEAVTRTEYARRKPLADAAAVTEGLRRALDGDAAYSGLMTKNPLHMDWSTEWLHGDLHTLGGLEEVLGDRMPPARWRETKRFRTNVTGLGRNLLDLRDGPDLGVSRGPPSLRQARHPACRHPRGSPEPEHRVRGAATDRGGTGNRQQHPPVDHHTVADVEGRRRRLRGHVRRHPVRPRQEGREGFGNGAHRAPGRTHRSDAGVHEGNVVTQEPNRERRTVTARELADRFGVSPRTVVRMVAEERAVYEDRSRQRRDHIVELHRQGLKGYEIARELSVSAGLVSIRLKEARSAGVDLTRFADAAEGEIAADGSGAR
ncbi:replication initiation protein [Streptomyces sp. NPDC051561]|uniref:replication initiation protein n=1 Tax=Streptomyces sp. NPDC051561 TaxID=3365658 RepID=UPI00379B3D8D